jgi:hypothetical protein
MPYLVLGVLLLIGFLLLARGFVAADPKSLVRVFKWSGLGIGGALVVYLALTRQLGQAIALAMLLAPLVLRWRSLGRLGRGWRSAGGANGSSKVETRFLRMSLDHESGVLDGTVLDGQFRGRKLSELGREQLAELLRECRVADEQSAQVLEAYLDRTHADWRAADDGASAAAGAQSGERRSRAWGRASPTMTREEAFQLLGLEPGASREEIKAAHHRLMRQFHPDMGGSDYLAARINEAKDVLLGE